MVAKAYPPETGGIETYSEELAKAYAGLGHKVAVLTSHPGTRGVEDRAGVAVHNVGQGTQLKVFFHMLKWLIAAKRTKYDFVHATTWRVAIPVLLTHLKQRIAVTIHGREVFVVPRLLRPVMFWVFRRAHQVPTVSQPILDKVRELTKQDLPQAYKNWNGISFKQEALIEPYKPSGFKVFCMCRMVERKNISNAITAVAELINEGLDIQFDIAGNGECLNQLKAKLDSLCVGDHIILHGRVAEKDIPGYYREAHAFLHPQIATRGGRDMEGFGLTIADGMAFGCVPIAGASGGPLDFIDHGQTGFLVNGHSIEEIKDRIRELYQNPKQMRAMSAKARQFALKELTWEKHATLALDRSSLTASKPQAFDIGPR